MFNEVGKIREGCSFLSRRKLLIVCQYLIELMVIMKSGSHFVIALKSSRTVKNHRVTEYFRRFKKGHSTITIRFIASGRKRITFQVRLATNVHLKGVRQINVVCSKGKSGAKTTTKYITSSDKKLRARDLVKLYRQHWSIETWHKEVKQKYGFGDCSCSSFAAVHAHVQFVLAAYLLQILMGKEQMTIESYRSSHLLKKVRSKLTKIG